MQSASEIRRKIEGLANGHFALADFYAWFVEQDIEEMSDSDRHLSERVDLLLSEHTGGYLRQEDLLRELANTVRPLQSRAISLPSLGSIEPNWPGTASSSPSVDLSVGRCLKRFLVSADSFSFPNQVRV